MNIKFRDRLPDSIKIQVALACSRTMRAKPWNNRGTLSSMVHTAHPHHLQRKRRICNSLLWRREEGSKAPRSVGKENRKVNQQVPRRLFYNVRAISDKREPYVYKIASQCLHALGKQTNYK